MSPVKERGYTKELLVMPFDHRASFQEKLFGIFGTPTPEQRNLVASYKMMIFEGFEKAVKSGLPKEMMAILVDEQFGSEVLQLAKQRGFTTCVCVEKSGQDEFDFEYGPDYGKHIEKVAPTFVKVLVRYNPEGDPALNARQTTRLVELSQYLTRTGVKFMFELLVPATKEQLAKCKEDKHTYDVELRPGLMVRAIHELQKAGIEADVWKLEGLDRTEDFQKVCDAARSGGRTNVACILLGRGENEAKVRHWLTVGAKVPGVVGFAVGRTVFWEPLKAFKENRATRDQAVDQMSQTYAGLCQLWMEIRASS
jgi:myo-inositol catabolism protein IolC